MVRRYPILSYFLFSFGGSWLGAFLVALPHLLRHEPIPKFAGLMMFPAMLAGPALVGIVMARIVDGREGLRDLAARMRCVSFPGGWWASLLIPPCLVLSVLLTLKTFVSTDYAPNRFLAGAGLGLVAGFFEEIGWMGFAFPKLRARFSFLAAASILGLLWGCWHIPVIDYLGTATPHGKYWWPFFGAFTLAMSAMRALIAWVYSHTKSVLLAQLMHGASTAALVVFSPAKATAGQEAFWYSVYAGALWLFVAALQLSGQFVAER